MACTIWKPRFAKVTVVVVLLVALAGSLDKLGLESTDKTAESMLRYVNQHVL
jgi:hypothetical protein